MWLLDTHPHEITGKVEDFLVFPPGVYHVVETVGNTAPNQICRIPLSAPNDPALAEVKCSHSFPILKPSISVNMLLVWENPAFARATLSRTNPIRSFKLKIESGLAASVDILAVISGL